MLNKARPGNRGGWFHRPLTSWCREPPICHLWKIILHLTLAQSYHAAAAGVVAGATDAAAVDGGSTAIVPAFDAAADVSSDPVTQ